MHCDLTIRAYIFSSNVRIDPGTQACGQAHRHDAQAHESTVLAAQFANNSYNSSIAGGRWELAWAALAKLW